MLMVLTKRVMLMVLMVLSTGFVQL